MKRYIVAFLFFFCISTAFAQVKIGLQVSPSLSFNRVKDESSTLNFSSNGVGARLVAGVLVDYLWQENYYISSGLFFLPKRVGVKSNNGVEEVYRLQYLQVPVALKLFTNEVALDTRVYFQVGLTADFKILEDNVSEQTLIDRFRTLDSSLLLSAGAEYRYGYNTILFGGFSYRRGLGNVVRREGATGGDLIVKNDLFSLDLGIKF